MKAHDILIVIIAVNVIFYVIGSVITSPIPVSEQFRQEADTEGAMETGENVEDTSEFGFWHIVVKAMGVLKTLWSFFYGFIDMLPFVFGTSIGIMRLVTGLKIALTILYLWLILEVFRGMKV